MRLKSADARGCVVAAEKVAERTDFCYCARMMTLSHSPVRSDPEVMGGTLVFRDTRVPVQSLLDYLRDGYSIDAFLEMFPSVDRADAVEFLRLARGEADADRP